MFALLLVAQVMTLVGMVAVSTWGRTHMDRDTRTRARVGAFGFDYTKSKNTTLIFAPVIGLLIVGSTFAIRDSGAPEAAAAMGLAIMLIFLAAHWSSVKRAAR